MNCVECKKNICAIQDILSACTIEQIISNEAVKSIKYPVCHKNAQKMENGRIVRGEKCDNCFLCEYICYDGDTSHQNIDVKCGALFSDLSRMNIYLKALLSTDAVVCSEVKAKGNAREKRIDIVIKRGKEVFLIKVLTDIDKIPYYSRSFNDIIAFYSSSTPKVQLIKRIVIPDKAKEKASSEIYVKTLSELITEIKEQ